MARVRYLNKEQKERYNLSQYPAFHATGNVKGMKKQFYGEDALLVRSGLWIYHVPNDVYILRSSLRKGDVTMDDLNNIDYYTEKFKRFEKFTDEEIKHLWTLLTDVCIDEDECIDDDWFIFKKGTFREEIWYWFDENYSKGVGWLMENID